MRKYKLLLLLVLLMTAATGAWAQETLLLTINSTDYASFTSGSKTFDDKVTVTFSNWVENEGDADGWYTITSTSLLTVAGTNGYTITSCKFYTDNGAANGYTVEGESPSVYLHGMAVYTDASKSVKIGDPGITKIEVYTAAASGSGSGEEAQTAKHLITATSDKTRSLEQPLPYATTIGELYEAVRGQSFDDLISTMSLVEMPLTGISSNNTSVVSIGELNGASTPVTVNADGKATININFSGYVQAIFVSAISPLYAYVKDGVKDDYKWTVKVGTSTTANPLPVGGLSEGDQVTIQYSGRLKVKGVKATSDAGAPTGNSVDLATLTADYEAQDGETLTGTLASNVKISIADGATVTLDGVTINGVNDLDYDWAGITCEGDATIILSGTNTVKGFYEDYPGIQAAAGKTLIINGTGSLTASSYGWGAGIGGVKDVACGNIEIQGGTITATSVNHCAGIGGGGYASCGNITISGGTVIAIGGDSGAGIGGADNASWGNITISGGTVTATGGWRGAGIGGGRRGSTGSVSSGNILISGGTITATGGENAAGIGGGRGNTKNTFSSCGTITITTGVTKVTATMGDGASHSIGAGYFGNCGTVTIGGTVYWQNNAAVGDGATYLATSPLIYEPSN